MTVKLVRLNRERECRIRAERASVRARLVAKAREIDDGIDGYALVVYRHNSDGSVMTQTDYCVRDSRDLYRLPDMAREKVSTAINSSTKTDEDD